MADHSKVLAFIAKCDDADSLKTFVKRARDRGDSAVADAAFRRLIALVPSEVPGTVEYDFWRMIHAFEFLLTEENERTTRLSRTRQKVDRVGVVQTLKDWALGDKDTIGFKILIDRGMAELTGEAIVIRHPQQFAPEVVIAAGQRLIQAGVDLSALPKTGE